MSSLRRLLKKKDLSAYCLLIFLSLAFFWKFFLKGLIPIPADTIVGIYYPWRDHIWNNLTAGVPIKNGLLSDVVSIIYPWRIYGIELLKKGIWPLWIPHALAGTPLLANFQSGIFYPLNFFFFLFSNVKAWSWYIILQPILASLFCFLYLRNLKLSQIASLIGGFIFAFSGFMLVWLEYGIVGHTGLWLPLVLLAIDKLFKKPSVLWVVIGSLGIGFSLLAGYPQLSAFLLVTSLLYAGWRYLVGKGKKKRAFLTILTIFILGIALSSVQLLPGFELWQLSIRQYDTSAAVFNYGLNPMKNLILFLAPDFYGNPATGNFWGEGAYNESVVYVSVAGFLLALIAFFRVRKNKDLLFFKALLAFSLIMAFANPLSNLIFRLRFPILASTSAGRFLFLTDFSLVILAAFGADLFLKRGRKRVKVFSLLAIVLILFTSLLVVIYLKPSLWPDQNLLANLMVAKRNLILPTALILVSLILLIITRLMPSLIIKKIFFSIIFFLILFDLFRFGFKYNPFVDKNYLYPKTNLTDFLRERIGLDRFYGVVPPSMFIPYNFSSPEGYDPMMIKRYNEFAYQINEEKFETIEIGRRWVVIHRHELPLLNLLGAKYLLSLNPVAKSDWDPWYFKYPQEKYELVFQYGQSQIYENKETLPRAFLVHDFQVLNDEEVFKILRDEEFDPTKTLLLEEKPQDLPEEKETDEDSVVVDKSSYFDNKVVVKTRSSVDGLLFLSDTYYPGWKAFIDGQETKIYRANYTFRAVHVPQGEHEIKFLFEPRSFKMGLMISAMIVLILGGLGSWDLIKKSALLGK